MELEEVPQTPNEFTESNSHTPWPTKISASKPEWARRLKKFGEKSSFSRATYGFRSKSWCKRVLWLVILLAAIGGFSYTTYQNILRFIREPISTSITESRQRSLDFPAVTICSLSFLNTTKLNKLSTQIPGYNITDMLNRLFYLVHYATPPDIPKCQSVAETIANVSSYSEGFGALITELARNDPSKQIVSCSFRGEDCRYNFTQIATVSGVCFTFNGPEKILAQKTSGTGSSQGLRLQLSNGQPFFSLNSNFGFNVIVHNRDEPPRPESEGVVAGLSSALYIGMKEVKSIEKTVYYSGQNCKEDLTYTTARLSFPPYTSYSPSLCLNDCFYTHVADECNCVERELYTPISSPYTQMKNCTVFDLCCEVRSFDTFVKDECDCPPRCKTVGRTLTTSSATNSDPKNVGINVYYETLVSELRQTEDSFTPWSLISAIGGNTGMFLGFTLLAWGESVLLVLALFTDCCCSSCKQRARLMWTNKSKANSFQYDLLLDQE